MPTRWMVPAISLAVDKRELVMVAKTLLRSEAIRAVFLPKFVSRVVNRGMNRAHESCE